MLIVQLQEIGLDLTFSMQEMLLRDIVEALLDTRDQMVKFSRHRAMVSDMKCKRGNKIVTANSVYINIFSEPFFVACITTFNSKGDSK